jgi:SOS response regulatory protein OraA/RecX
MNPQAARRALKQQGYDQEAIEDILATIEDEEFDRRRDDELLDQPSRQPTNDQPKE